MALPLRVEGVTKRFGGLLALDAVSVEAVPGRITSIIGQNGAGKTTLLNTISQLPPPDSGRVYAGDTERANGEKARRILDELQLSEIADVEAGTLSYGLQKLVSLARAVATDAEILMLDEPTSGLSADFIARILSIVKRMREGGMTIVLVEHDMDVVFEVSDRIVVMDQGKVFAEGSPSEIRSNADVRTIYFGSRVG
jgi:branched-chain amino acid transport system ATP-binding protein